MTERGKSIVIEGNDGTGKSTQVEMLAEWLRNDYGINSYIVHEPDGPGISGEIRKIIKNGNLDRQPITNLLLFLASRAEQNHIGEQHMAAGHWLLKARDKTSTDAYQGGGEGIPQSLIDDLHRLVMSDLYLHPDLKVILGLNDTARSLRIAERGELINPDTFEMRGQQFQSAVDQTYYTIAMRDNYPYLDASGSRDKIHNEIKELLWIRGLLPRR